MLKQDDTHTHKKTHVAGGLDCETDTTKNSKAGINYNLASYIFKHALIIVLAVIYVPVYLALMLILPLLPTRLSKRLVGWLAAEQEGI